MVLDVGRMNLRRKLLISLGKVEDHAAKVTASDALKSSQRGALRSGKEDNLLLSSLERSIEDAYGSMQPVPPHDPALLDFLEKECQMVLEHKDGSFMDHLQFGHEYAAQHFPGHSPRVLLLHSIMGLGNNYFPMPKDKIPKLRSLISDFEFRHVEAFPSFVRLWCHGGLPAKLLGESAEGLARVRGITFHRVIDNSKVSLSARDFWIQLNYQLVHFADFFPAAFWAEGKDDASLLIFRIYCEELMTVLSRAGKVMANVGFNPCIHVQDVPESCQLHRRMQRWKKVSDKIGHSLDYKIQWGLQTVKGMPGHPSSPQLARQPQEGAPLNLPASRL